MESLGKLYDQPSRSQRPGRLEGAVAKVEHPCSQDRGVVRQPISADFSELRVFRHLEALEEAVQSGEALAGRIPTLPTNLQKGSDPPIRSSRRLLRDKLDAISDCKDGNDAASIDVERSVVYEQSQEQVFGCLARFQQGIQEHTQVELVEAPRLGSQIQRPGRLEEAAPDVENPCPRLRNLLWQPKSVDSSELVVFKHLAALEEAVQRGETLAGRFPEIPSNLESTTKQSHSVPLAVGSVALRSVGGGLLAKAPISVPPSGPRYYFGEDCYGMKPPLKPGARKHATNQMAFGRSALRGTALQQYHHASHASALWINTEAARLHSEMPKSYGTSPTIAFLQNDGPQALDCIRSEMCISY